MKRMSKTILKNLNLIKKLKATDIYEYVDKLEVEEKSYSDLLKLEKAEIIEFKDYQIK